jgi:hypothetical protein
MPVHRLHTFLPDRIELLAIDAGIPILRHRGELPVPPGLDARLAAERARLSAPGRYNERQAVFAGDFDPRMVSELPFYDAEYALITSLRAAGQAPFVLSASVLLVCDETREIFVQRRSAFCDAAAGLLHTVSGAQKYPLSHGADVELLETAWREVREETGLILGPDPGVPLVLIRERMATSFQFLLPGTRITRAQAERIHTSVEGEIVAIGFDALEASLAQPLDWAATGYFHVLVWLALDGRGPTFGGKTGASLVDGAFAATRHIEWPSYL